MSSILKKLLPKKKEDKTALSTENKEEQSEQKPINSGDLKSVIEKSKPFKKSIELRKNEKPEALPTFLSSALSTTTSTSEERPTNGNSPTCCWCAFEYSERPVDNSENVYGLGEEQEETDCSGCTIL